jgi:hydrogenase maturation protease
MHDEPECILVLGIGNVLMGDEGIGVEVARRLQGRELPDGITCLDGGTGSFALLEPLDRAERVILVDATADGDPPGTVKRLCPRFSSDYPPTLTAHDVGLKDLLDALYLVGDPPPVTLFAVSIRFPQPMRLGLSSELQRRSKDIERAVLDELATLRASTVPRVAGEPASGAPG